MSLCVISLYQSKRKGDKLLANMQISFTLASEYFTGGQPVGELYLRVDAEVKFGITYYDDVLHEEFTEEDEVTIVAITLGGAYVRHPMLADDCREVIEKAAIKAASEKLNGAYITQQMALNPKPAHNNFS